MPKHKSFVEVGMPKAGGHCG